MMMLNQLQAEIISLIATVRIRRMKMVPPMRQRKEDVAALTRHFVTVRSRDWHRGAPVYHAGSTAAAHGI